MAHGKEAPMGWADCSDGESDAELGLPMHGVNPVEIEVGIAAHLREHQLVGVRFALSCFFARRGVHIGGRDGFREDIAIDCGRVHFDVFCEAVQQGSHVVPGIPHRKLVCRILEVAREALRSESAGCSEIGSKITSSLPAVKS